MRKVALVDFDKVLFDSDKFKVDYFEYLSQWFLLKIVEKVYVQSKSDGFFNADKHCNILDFFSVLNRGTLIKTKFLLFEWFESEQDKFQSKVFFDTELFLRLLGNQGYEVYILTLGTEWFQKAKIEGVGLLQFISGYTVTETPTKCKAMLELCDPKKDGVVLFDDSKLVIDSVKLIFPRVVAIQVLRDGNSEKISERADAVVKNLEEAMGALLAR